MLNLLDASLESFLRSVVPLPERTVDLVFDAPDKEWGSAVTKPTINLYLWDVRRHAGGAESGMEVVEREDGSKFRRPPKPRVDCRYFVSAWTADVRDEHALLGGVLAALLPRDEIPAEFLEGAYAPVRPLPGLVVGSPGEADKSDFWSALGGQLKPGLDLLVTATVEAFLASEAGPPVERYQVNLSDGGAETEFTVVGGVDAPPGTLVTSPRGKGVVHSDGQFTVRADPGDTVVIHGDSTQDQKVSTRTVPETGTITATKRRARKSRKTEPKKSET